MYVGDALVGLERVHAAVLEEAPDDRADVDVLGEPLDAGTERAGRAGDDVDLRAGLRGGVELLDDLRVDEVVELEPDARVLAVRCGGCDRADLVDEPAAERERRDEQLAELLRPPEAGDVVEEVGDVGGDLLVGGEDPEVLVEPRRRRVVVPGADVGVATERVALAPDDERHLRVDLEIGEAVRDVDARLLERSRPLDVAELVEAGLELDEADRLLPVLGALDERADEHAVVARAVHGRLHRDDVRIAHGSLREHLEARR